MTFALDYTTLSDRGLVRGNNEDSAYAGPHLLALADGMGGHAAGEVASQLMIGEVSKLDEHEPSRDLLSALNDACMAGNSAILDEIQVNPQTQGMGTTLTALLFDGDRLGMCHVGDSRGYLLRDGELIRITRDDTYVQSLVDEGQLTEEEASVHPQKSLILKALTGHPVEPTLEYRDVMKGDRYLLCSDGLSDPVSLDTIADALRTGSPQDAAERLVSLALRSGGPDNVTVVIADVVDSEQHSPTEPSLAGALNVSDDDWGRPDTAAGRAAALKTKNSGATAPGQASASGAVGQNLGARESAQIPGADDGGDTEGASTRLKNKRSNKGRFLVFSVVLLLIVALAGVGLWGWKKKEAMYYLANEGGVIQVMHGVPGALLGMSLNDPHQLICLSDNNEVQLLPPGTAKDRANCHLMTPDDLAPAARSSLDGLPADSYDNVSQQIGRLASQALPVCLQLSDDQSGNRNKDKETNSEKLGAKPGENCREVRK